MVELKTVPTEKVEFESRGLTANLISFITCLRSVVFNLLLMNLLTSIEKTWKDFFYNSRKITYYFLKDLNDNEMYIIQSYEYSPFFLMKL